MNLSDAEILASLCAGDDSAFGELVDRYRPRLLRFAVRSLGDLPLAEDLVQETFAAVYAASDTYHPRFAVSTWIWTILLNLCRKQRRGDRSRERLHSEWAAVSLCRQQPADTALDELVRSEEAQRLRKHLACLPAAQADALRLRFFAELSFDDIAAAMNSSVSGAKVRVRKGLTALSEQLKRDESAAELPSAPAIPEDDAT